MNDTNLYMVFGLIILAGLIIFLIPATIWLRTHGKKKKMTPEQRIKALQSEAYVNEFVNMTNYGNSNADPGHAWDHDHW